MSDLTQSDGSDMQDDIHVEVSDTRAGEDNATPPPARSPFAPHYTWGQRATRVAIGLLALALVVSGITGVGGRMLAALRAPGPTPMPTDTPVPPPLNVPNFPANVATTTPGSDLAANEFYLLPNPPGVTVTLDGHALASVPALGDAHPLQLAPGHHDLAWTSRIYPFPPLRCTLSVPHANDDTCVTTSSELGNEDEHLAGHVIAIHESLATLPVPVATQLTYAVQAALGGIVSHATVQPGEQYYFYHDGTDGGPVTATQTLRAMLSYDFVPNSGYYEPCILTQPVIPCRFTGQDCSELCTVTKPPQAVLTSPDDWIAAAEVHANWSYSAADGTMIAQNLGESFGIQLAVMRITWDGGLWRATPILGAVPGLPAAADLVCDPARYWVGANNVWSFMVADPPPGASAVFIADATPADGCLVVLNPHPPDVQSMVFLERFGVLVEANALDATERQLVQKLAAQPGASGANIRGAAGG